MNRTALKPIRLKIPCLIGPLTFLFLVASFNLKAAPLPAEKPNLDFLLGTWFVDGMNMYETWEKDGNGYKGRGYFLIGQEEKLFENFRVAEKEGTWYYIAEPVGQESVAFALTEMAENRAVFKNDENDMPHTIVYWMEEGQRKVRLEGNQQGQDVAMTFNMNDPSGTKPLQAASGPSISPLGGYAQVSIGTNDLEANAAFYKKLGFKVISQDNAPWPWIMLSDGAVNIQLNNDGFEYFGLNYFDGEMAAKIDGLKKKDIAFFMENNDPVPMSVMLDPDSLMGIALIQYASPIAPILPKAEGPLGILGEISIPVKDYEASSAWYQSVGFKSQGKQTSPYLWGIHSDGLNLIGLHQTNMFSKPTLTYFSLNSKETIQRLRDAGLDVKDFMSGDSKNGVVVSPDGWPVNIFYGTL